MSNVVREDIDSLNAKLTVTVKKEAYEPKLNDELKKLKGKASLKGFRKGKTPIGFIKKMYGKPTLAEVVNKELQDALFGYIDTEKMEILGQPIATEDQELLDFDVNNLTDYTFKFDVGLVPQFEVNGVSKETVLEKFAVEVDKETIDKEMESGLKRAGQLATVEEPVVEGDSVTFNAEELDGDKLKDKGWATTFTILADRIQDEEVKKDLIGKKKGDKIRFNIYNLENQGDMNYTRKYLLNIPEGEDQIVGQMFEGEITDVKRMKDAEMGQDFFDRYFGPGEVSSEKEARDKIEDGIKKYHDSQADALLYRDLQDLLLEKNDVQLPEAFLKRWLQISNDKLSAEQIENEFEGFATNLKRSLVQGKLVKRFDVKVSEEELVDTFKDKVRGYFGGQADEHMVLNMASRLMEDRKQVEQAHQEKVSEKLFGLMKEEISIKPKSATLKEFEEAVKAAQAASQPPAPVETEETAEVAENVEEA